MNLLSGISAVGTFVRNTTGELTHAAISGVERAAEGQEHAAETTAQGALSEVARRLGDNEDLNKALNKLGQVAARPTSQALQPHIIAAAVAAVVAIAVIVYLARRK